MDVERALIAIDQLLRANELIFKVLAAIPGIVFIVLVSSRTWKFLFPSDSNKKEREKIYLKLRETLVRTECALVEAQVEAEAEKQRTLEMEKVNEAKMNGTVDDGAAWALGGDETGQKGKGREDGEGDGESKEMQEIEESIKEVVWKLEEANAAVLEGRYLVSLYRLFEVGSHLPSSVRSDYFDDLSKLVSFGTSSEGKLGHIRRMYHSYA